MYEHVPIYHSIVFDSTPSYTLCALTSHHRVRCNSGLKQLAKCRWHVTNTPCKAPQKSVEGATALFVCLSVLSYWMRQNIARAYGTGVGARRGHWFLIAIMLLLVIRHPTCASCVAWMCCRMSNSIKHVWACPDQSSRCGHRSLLQSCCCWCYVIQPVHHVLHECVVGCPILSSMYEHVPIYLQLHISSWTVHLLILFAL